MYVCLIVCDVETSTVRRPRPALGCCGANKRGVSRNLETKLEKLGTVFSEFAPQNAVDLRSVGRVP